MIIPAVLILVMVAVYFFTPVRDYLTVEKVKDLTQAIPGNLQTALIFMIIYFLGGCLLLPMPLAAFAMGLIFPLTKAIPLCLLGGALAAVSGYLLGRLVDIDILGKWVGRHLKAVRNKLDGHKSAFAVFALRVAPTPPYTVTSILSGSLKLPFVSYVLASTAGVAPLMLLVLFFGKNMLEMLKDPTGVGISATVAILIFIGIYFIIRKKKFSD